MKSLKNHTKSVVLLKTWQDGENGYRIYSDGFCVQYSICYTSANAYTATLHVPFKTEKYSLVAVQIDSTNDTGGFCENLGICATSGNNGMYRDKFRVSLQPGSRGFTWQALGTVDLEEVL